MYEGSVVPDFLKYTLRKLGWVYQHFQNQDIPGVLNKNIKMRVG